MASYSNMRGGGDYEQYLQQLAAEEERQRVEQEMARLQEAEGVAQAQPGMAQGGVAQASAEPMPPEAVAGLTLGDLMQAGAVGQSYDMGGSRGWRGAAELQRQPAPGDPAVAGGEPPPMAATTPPMPPPMRPAPAGRAADVVAQAMAGRGTAGAAGAAPMRAVEAARHAIGPLSAAGGGRRAERAMRPLSPNVRALLAARASAGGWTKMR